MSKFGIELDCKLPYAETSSITLHHGSAMSTEAVSPRYAALDLWPTADVVAALADSQLAATAIVRAAVPALAAAAEAVAERLEHGDGRIVYAGAGASGRLGVQDGVELFPTYGWPDRRLIYLMAGGDQALAASVEGAEDSVDQARTAVREHRLGADDAVLCIAASGRTPYTVAVAETARQAGALVVGIANNPGAPLLAAADHPILLDTGPEVVAGSTRMAAGTAQKAALNILSTSIMVRLGHTYGNLMVDLASSNRKLDARRIAMLQQIVDVDDTAAAAALTAADGHVKSAALVASGAAPERAGTLLTDHGGRLRAALSTVGPPDDTGSP